MISNENMVWDEHKRRYYVTESYVMNECDIMMDTMLDDEFVANESKSVKIAIKDACDMVWDFMRDNAFDYWSSLYFVTHDREANTILKEALGMQVDFYTLHGDIANKEGSKLSERISNGVISKLKGAGILTKAYYKVPNYEEW